MLEVKGKYCTAKIFADTIEDGLQLMEVKIINYFYISINH
jgi:hypothetical protein